MLIFDEPYKLPEQNADVRARFLAHFKKPDFRLKSPLLAPPLTKSYGLAGTVFDYPITPQQSDQD